MATISVQLPVISNKSDYIAFPDETRIKRIVKELDPIQLQYKVRFRDGHSEIVSLELCVKMKTSLSCKSTLDDRYTLVTLLPETFDALFPFMLILS